MSATIVTPQNLYTAFGPVSEISIGGNISGMFLGDFNGDGETDFGVYSSSQITLLYNSPSEIVSSKILRFKDRIEKVAAADCNRDGLADLFVLTLNPTMLSVYLSKRDTFRIEWAEELPFVADDIAVGDMNNDRKPDIILYGKKILGVYVLLGYGNGAFSAPRLLLEDYSFSQMILHDLNEDRMMDILGYDWVKNELLLFSGIGQLRFSIPTSKYLPSELMDVHYAYINDDHNLDLVMVFKDEKELRVYYGDGLGNFSEESTVSLPFIPTKILVQDINGNGRNDIIVFSKFEKSFSTYFNDGKSITSTSVSYSAGMKPVDILAFRSGRENEVNLVILDKQGRSLFIYHHYLHSHVPDKEQRYALGVRPQSIYVFDANKNGLPDILVSNAHSNHISLFLNRGNGTFYGQIPIITERFAESMYAVWRDDSTFVCFTAHPTIDKIIMTEVSYPNFESKFSAIPAPPQVEILSISYDTLSRSFTFLVSGREFSTYSISEILWYDQRNAVVERPYFQMPNSVILAVDVCDLNKDGIRDVVYLSKDEKKRKTDLNVSVGGSDGKFTTPQMMYSLPDTGIRGARLWCIDLNRDENIDLLIHYHSDNYYMGFAYGKGNGEFTPIRDIFSQIMIRNRNDISSIDIDGDGMNDLIIANALTKMIQVFPARGSGRFAKPKRLLSFPSDGSFAVFDCNQDQIPDYAVIYTDPGMLKIFLGKE